MGVYDLKAATGGSSAAPTADALDKCAFRVLGSRSGLGPVPADGTRRVEEGTEFVVIVESFAVEPLTPTEYAGAMGVVIVTHPNHLPPYPRPTAVAPTDSAAAEAHTRAVNAWNAYRPVASFPIKAGDVQIGVDGTALTTRTIVPFVGFGSCQGPTRVRIS
jgi:hypothetical protein